MYNLVYLAQARKKHYKMVIDEEENQSGDFVLLIIHQQTEEVKMIGIETSNGLYEAMASVCNAEANISSAKRKPYWHHGLVHYSMEILQATVPKREDIEKDVSNCELLKFGKST